MTPRQRRITLVVGILGGVSLAGVLALSAFRENVMFFSIRRRWRRARRLSRSGFDSGAWFALERSIGKRGVST